MAKINVLDSIVFNKISAGEVVERPASVVKELIENSIDAGAKNIMVEIEEGGIDRIKIQDDGCGIERDDVINAFKPHATSKIANAEDLACIKTMGFRGEALASIASVSQVEMYTKTDSEELGTYIQLNGGEIVENKQLQLQVGTTIIINNLFFNVPARKKFLKKPKLEENAVTDIVSRLILTHYNIAFTYIVNGKEIFSTTGLELEEALYAVYGKQILDNIIKLEYSKYGIEINGYIGKPIFAKPNRSYQTLSINHRYIQNSNVSYAVQKAYENYLMKGKFPFFVLNINLPGNCVDVNVHPQKMEVRLENDGQVFGSLYKAVQDAMLKHRELASFSDFGSHFKDAMAVNTQIVQEMCDTKEKISQNLFNGNPLNYCDDNNKLNNENNRSNDSKDDDKKILNKFNNIQLSDNEIKTINTEESVPKMSFSSCGTSPLHTLEHLQSLNIDNNATKNDVFYKQDTFLQSNSYKIIGVLFDTYILIQQGEDFIIIDQHATHERLLYEKLKLKIENKNFSSHTLIIPYVFDVTPQENEIILTVLPGLEELGFEIEQFGYLSFKVNAIPFDDYVVFDCKSFIENILKTNFKTGNLKNNFNEFLATRACKCAVKAGDRLSNEEIEFLIKEINENDTPLFCPHGRPIAIKFERKDVEKWFKRII